MSRFICFFVVFFLISRPVLSEFTFVPQQLIVQFSTSSTQPSHSFSIVASLFSTQSINPFLSNLPVTSFKSLDASFTPGISRVLAAMPVNLPQTFLMTFTPDSDLDHIQAVLKQDPRVIDAQKNYIHEVHPPDQSNEPSPYIPYLPTQFIPNDDQLLKPKNSVHLALVNAFDAWSIITSNSNIIAAVIDTGIVTNHPDLQSVFFSNPGENNPNIYLNIHDSNNTLSDLDPVTHGTHVSGIIGAMGNNHIGIAGISYGCKILNIKASHASLSGTSLFKDSDIHTALSFARQFRDSNGNAVSVINLSFGGSYPPNVIPSYINQINLAVSNNTPVVVAAGNVVFLQPPGSDLDQLNIYPAKSEKALTITGSNDQGIYDPSRFYCGTSVDLLAPGFAYSTVDFGGSSYRTLTGTSMASPIVAGAICLLKTVSFNLSIDQIRYALIQSADDRGTPFPQYIGKYGAGLLNIPLALAYVVTAAPTAEHTPYSLNKQVPLNQSIPVTLNIPHSFYETISFKRFYKVTLNYKINDNSFQTVTSSTLIINNQTKSGTVTFKLPTPSLSVETISYYFEVGNLGTENKVNSGSRFPPSDTFSLPIQDITPPTISFENYGAYFDAHDPILFTLTDNIGVSLNSLRIQLWNDSIPTQNLGLSDVSFSNSVYTIDASVLKDFYQSPDLYIKITVSDTASTPNTQTLQAHYIQNQDFLFYGPEGPGSPVINAPNPFNPDLESTYFCFETAQNIDLSITVYSLFLKRVYQHHTSLPAGYHELLWRGVDQSGDKLPSGVYIFVIQAAYQSQTIVKKGKIAIIR